MAAVRCISTLHPAMAAQQRLKSIRAGIAPALEAPQRLSVLPDRCA
jgi:hypothetical protein